VIKSVLWGTAAALVLAASPALAELKIGVVSYARLMQESPQAKAANAELNAEFSPRKREIDRQGQALKTREEKLQRDEATMTDEQRGREEQAVRDTERDLQRKQTELQDDYTERRNEALSRLQRVLVDEVTKYAKAQNYDLVIAEGVIYASSVIDITPAIRTRLQQAGAVKPGTGAAPKTTKSTGGQ
jgi:outer membrane protein